MFEELKKSIGAILYERTTSPLFGSILVSWSIWNWRIIYLTLFVSEDKIEGNKIDYIYGKLWNHDYLLWYPLISTVVVLTLMPFISNGAYWLSIRFENWKINQKNIIERKHLLSLEQSIAMREEIYSQEKKFESLLSSKEYEITQFKQLLGQKDLEIENLNKEFDTQGLSINQTSTKDSEEQSIIDMKDIILTSPNLVAQFEETMKHIQAGWMLANNVNTEFIALLESDGYINNKGGGKYEFSELGRRLQSLVLRNKFKTN